MYQLCRENYPDKQKSQSVHAYLCANYYASLAYHRSFSRFHSQDEHNASCSFMLAAQIPP